MFLLAILLGLYSVAIPADADALSPGEWFVTGYYRVTSDGVMGYNGRYVMDGGAQEIESSLYAGQVVYAKVAYSSMGITWYCCFSEEEHSPDAIYYGWVDVSYLVPVGQEPENQSRKPIHQRKPRQQSLQQQLLQPPQRPRPQQLLLQLQLQFLLRPYQQRQRQLRQQHKQLYQPITSKILILFLTICC